MCTHCGNNKATCIISILTKNNAHRGLDAQEIARLCNACVEMLMSQELQIETFSTALSFDQAIESFQKP